MVKKRLTTQYDTIKLQIIRHKINRIRTGRTPRILDLFAGCGGLSLGFHAAGFQISAAIENDQVAAASHGLNFHDSNPLHSIARDITSTSPKNLVEELNLGRTPEAFDIVIGGPPCQAFARVGRPKLREIDEHPEAFLHDPRARLYIDYIRYVEDCLPLVVLMENVPDVLNHGGQNIAEEICDVLTNKGYICRYTLLNTVYYGVPQMRERMFLIAYHQEISDVVRFPIPTHWVDLPQGYQGSRAVALKSLSKYEGKNSAKMHYYIEAPVKNPTLLPAITAQEAIGDLPPIRALKLLKSGKLKRGARRFTDVVRYNSTNPISEYGHLMKSWSGFEASEEGIKDHVIRYLPRDYLIFSRMNHGDQYPEAHWHAMNLLNERIMEMAQGGSIPQPGSEEYEKLKKEIVPPYDVGKFPNKWRKLWPDQPVRTLMAHLGKDSYSHIHYDSNQARTISVREAARLQSFPDGFLFSGTMNSAFRQIGNAVPPIMAMALAREIKHVLIQSAQEEKFETYRAAAAVY